MSLYPVHMTAARAELITCQLALQKHRKQCASNVQRLNSLATARGHTTENADRALARYVEEMRRIDQALQRIADALRAAGA